MRNIFITGIGTGIGKTLVSALITEKLQADYWKPIQSGDLDNSDSLKVKELISNPITKIHQEAYRLTKPQSPHISAHEDGVSIRIEDIKLPHSNNTLIIEGAGGLMVPLNDKELMIDLIQSLDVEVVLVSMNYLGSINHTLLSIEALQRRNIPITGIIFNGPKNPSTEDYILKYTSIACLGFIPMADNINKIFIQEQLESIII